MTLLSQTMFSQPSLNAIRYSDCLRLFPQARSKDGSLKIPLEKDDPIIVANLVANVLAASRILPCGDDLSRKVVYTTAIIGAMGLWQFAGGALLGICRDSLRNLQGQVEGLDLKVEMSFIEERIAERISTHAAGIEESKLGEDQRELLRTLKDQLTKCKECHGVFQWEDLKVAECSGGHRYRKFHQLANLR